MSFRSTKSVIYSYEVHELCIGENERIAYLPYQLRTEISGNDRYTLINWT